MPATSARTQAQAWQRLSTAWRDFADETAVIAAGVPACAIAAPRRGVFFVDRLRRFGNDGAEIAARPRATVPRLGHEAMTTLRSLARSTKGISPRIVPPPGLAIDAQARPVVAVDPRAFAQALPGRTRAACLDTSALRSTREGVRTQALPQRLPVPTDEELTITRHTLSLLRPEHVQESA